MGWTCTLQLGVTSCSLDASTLDYLTTALQGVWFIAGACIGGAVVGVINVVWRRV